MSNINQLTPFFEKTKIFSSTWSIWFPLTLAYHPFHKDRKSQNAKIWKMSVLSVESMNEKLGVGRGSGSITKARSKGNWLWILWQSTSCPSCLLRLLTAGQARIHPTVYFLWPLQGPYLLHRQLVKSQLKSEPQAALPPARFNGRKAASPGPFLVSSGPQQARISDLFQSQKINYQLRKNF